MFRISYKETTSDKPQAIVVKNKREVVAFLSRVEAANGWTGRHQFDIDYQDKIGSELTVQSIEEEEVILHDVTSQFHSDSRRVAAFKSKWTAQSGRKFAGSIKTKAIPRTVRRIFGNQKNLVKPMSVSLVALVQGWNDAHDYVLNPEICAYLDGKEVSKPASKVAKVRQKKVPKLINKIREAAATVVKSLTNARTDLDYYGMRIESLKELLLEGCKKLANTGTKGSDFNKTHFDVCESIELWVGRHKS